MKRYAICVALIIAAAVLPGSAGTVLKLPPVKTAEMDNGARLFYIQDELPQVTIVVSAGFGKMYENGGNAGISDLMAQAVTLGGSKRYPGNALHEKVDAMGGRLSIDAAWEHMVISLKVLDRFRDEALDIVADLVANPNIEEKYLDTAKALVADSIRRKYDDPAEIAFDRARSIIFGGEGYGASPTEAGVRSCSIEMVKETWAKHFAGRNMMIGMYAQLPFVEAERLCRARFSAVPAGVPVVYPADRKNALAVVASSKNKIFFYPKDIPQSTVVVGTVAPDISHPGTYPLEVMNYILGGGSFSSRLMSEIRVKRGLAYAVQSIMRFRYRSGVFLAYAQTENRSAGQVLSLLAGNIARMTQEAVPGGEIAWAQKAISNSFVFQFDTPLNIMTNYMAIEYNRLPADYYTSYLSHINAVTGADIMRESRDLFSPGLVTVVVGNESVIPELKKLGEVVMIR
jgi:zinc protease